MAEEHKEITNRYRAFTAGITLFFWIIFLVWIVFGVVNASFKRENNRFTGGEVVELQGPWFVEGVEVEVPGAYDTGETSVTMTTTLPDQIPEGATLLIKGSHQDIEVCIDHKPVAQFAESDSRWFSHHSPSVYLRVPLDHESHGKQLDITYSALESDTAGRLHEVRMGSDSALLLWIIENYSLDVVAAVLLLYSGFLIALFGIIMRMVLHDNPNTNISYLGITAICTAIWMLGESWAKQFYYGDLILGEWIFWSALFLAPIPMLFYVSRLLERRYHLVYLITAAVCLLADLGVMIMSLLGYRDFFQNHLIGWGVLLICGLVILGTIAADWIRGLHRVRLTLGTLMMMAGVVLQIIGYIRQSDSLFRNNFFSIGMIIFLILMAVSAYRSVWSQQRDQQIAIRANETKSDFLANMSHEIRTPINAMLGFDEMILREESDPRIIEYATNIKKAGDSLLILINDILDFSKIESGKMELVEEEYSTSEMLSDVINMTYIRAREKGLTFDVFVGKNIPRMLYGDLMRVKQILTNLLNNSVKYTESGSIVLKVEYDIVEGKRGRLRVIIEDTGIGIREEDMEHLTEAFQRLDLKRNRSIEGSGLGMTIVSDFLNLMGGSIDISSEYGHGTTFRVLIPQRIVDETPIMNYQNDYRDRLKERKRYREKFTAPQAKILFVDDNLMNLSVARGLLKKTKIQIDTTDSGAGCLELTMKNDYDLIFMDHLMPEMDGIETLHRLRKDESNPNHDTPMVALTANAISGSREFYKNSGFIEYLSKPIDTEKLEDMLIELLPKEYIIPAEEMAENVLDRLKHDSSNRGEANPDRSLTKEDCLSELFVLLEQSHIDILSGYRFAGNSMGQFHWMIRLFAENFAEKYVRLLYVYNNNLTEEYTIEVHALKSNSKGVGAWTLSQIAWEHEQQSRSGNWTYVTTHWDELIQEWRVVVDGILAYCGEDPVDLKLLAKKAHQEQAGYSITTAQRMLIDNAMEFIRQYDSDPALALLENLRLEDLSPEVVDVVNQVVTDLDNFNFEQALDNLGELQ